MVSPVKKIAVLLGSGLPGFKPEALADWLGQMPELNIIAKVEPVFIFGKNAVDTGPAVWLKLAEEIKKRLNQYDGFVVLHGIDNLLYTSSALSFLLQNLDKPVIFTGSQQSVKNKQPGLRANLINAVQVAAFNFSDVGLIFGNRLLRANQASWVGFDSLNIFAGPESAVVGRIDFSIRIFDRLTLKPKGQIKSYNKLNTNIEIVEIQPILNLKTLARQLVDRDGIVVNAGFCQNLPEDLVFLFEKVTQDVPVVIWSQTITSAVLGPKNLILVNNLTWPTTVTKLTWALAQTKNLKKIKELMEKNIAGEIIGEN